MTDLVTLTVRRGKIRALGIDSRSQLASWPGVPWRFAVDPQNNVRGFYDTLLTTMKEGRTLGRMGAMRGSLPLLIGFSTYPS